MTMKNLKKSLTVFFLLAFTFLLPVKNVFADLAPSNFTDPYDVTDPYDFKGFTDNSSLYIKSIVFGTILLIVVIVAFYILMKSRKKKNDNDNK